MRSQSSGQGVLTKQHKQHSQLTAHPKSSASTTTTSLTDPMGMMAINSHSPSSSSHSLGVVVDPSLDHILHSGHNMDGLGVPSDGDSSPFSSSHLMNMPFTSNSSMMRDHFPFNDPSDHHLQDESHIQDPEPATAAEQEATDMLLRSATPDGEADADTERGEDDSQFRSVRLPPILQVEKQLVTTTATQAASATRRKNEAVFKCPVPGCGSTFTRRFNLRGHLRSHTEERPFVCDWPGCGKGFARSHDCKRHTALHTAKQGSHVCAGCNKTFSRTDALNRHLKSDVGASCRGAVSEAQLLQPSGSSRQGSQPFMADMADLDDSIPSPPDMPSFDVDSSIRPVSFVT